MLLTLIRTAICAKWHTQSAKKDWLISKLLENEKAALTLLNSKHLAHARKYCRTRQDVPCKHCACLACYVDLSIENTQDKSNENDCAPRRSLRQRS